MFKDRSQKRGIVDLTLGKIYKDKAVEAIMKVVENKIRERLKKFTLEFRYDYEMLWCDTTVPVFDKSSGDVIVDDTIINVGPGRPVPLRHLPNAQNNPDELCEKLYRSLCRKRHRHWFVHLIYHEYCSTFNSRKYIGLSAHAVRWGKCK